MDVRLRFENGLPRYFDRDTGDELTEAEATPNLKPRQANRINIIDKAKTAHSDNKDYLAIASPTAAQSRDQVVALTRQMNGLIRLVVKDLTGND